MILKIAYFLIFGKPLIFYTGILTFCALWLAALVGYLNFRGVSRISFKWHPRLAASAIVLSLIHALFALSAYFNL